jgi:hypothetical protein
MAEEAFAKKTQDREVGEICFTIMPFGGWFDTYYEEVFRPAIKDAGLTPRRADDIYRPGTIVDDIWDLTKKARVILADLTDKNPNVLYELGLAHAIAKPVVMVTESLVDIPFDLRSLRIIEYDKESPNWGEILKVKISKSIIELLESPLRSVLPAFLEVEEKIEEEKEKVSPQELAVLELRQEIENLRRDVRTSGSPSVRDQINPHSARSLIEEMVKQRMPKQQITERMLLYGVPVDWTIEEIEDTERGLADKYK